MQSVFRVSIRHNFETAHRLFSPDAPEKCRSIHGHSWWVTIFLEGTSLDKDGMLIEFGLLKKHWRRFLDGEVDHHLLLKTGDPLGEAILKVEPQSRIRFLPKSPTTENIAEWLWKKASEILQDLSTNPSLRVSKVHVQETSVNAAEFEIVM